MSTGEFGTQVPTKFGELPEQEPEPRHPLPDASTRSAALRPNVGWPQTRMSSFVCIGPAMTSPGANWISVQVSLKRDQVPFGGGVVAVWSQPL